MRIVFQGIETARFLGSAFASASLRRGVIRGCSWCASAPSSSLLHGAHRRLARRLVLYFRFGFTGTRLGLVGARRAYRARRLQRRLRPQTGPRRSERPGGQPRPRLRRSRAPARRIRPPAQRHGDQGRDRPRQGAVDRAAARRRDRGAFAPGQATRRVGCGARSRAGDAASRMPRRSCRRAAARAARETPKAAEPTPALARRRAAGGADRARGSGRTSRAGGA